MVYKIINTSKEVHTLMSPLIELIHSSATIGFLPHRKKKDQERVKEDSILPCFAHEKVNINVWSLSSYSVYRVENLSPAMGRGVDSRNRVWN